MEAINEEIFRAYDIRGTYPKTINERVAFTIGRSYGSYLQEKYKGQIEIESGFEFEYSDRDLAHFTRIKIKDR